MKKGFTILEFLVASMLLGMLLTVLTMVFTQSSISWRIGMATVSDLDNVVKDGSRARKDADNYYLWNNKADAIVSIWTESGNLRTRTLASLASDVKAYEEIQTSEIKNISSESTKAGSWGLAAVGTGDSGHSAKTYTVNVMSAGPNRKHGDWDDIWSFPDEFN